MNVVRTALGFEGTVADNISNVIIRLSLSKIREEDDKLAGLLKVYAETPTATYHVYTGNFNVSSAQNRKNTVSYIEDIVRGSHLEDIEWKTIIERFASEVFKKYFEPVQAERLTFTEDTDIPYLLYPLLPARMPVLLYGPGGTGKSLFALYIATLLQSGKDLHLQDREPTNVLYVDWELDDKTMSVRFTQIVVEKLDRKEPPFYLRAKHPLADELDNILTNVERHKIKLVILDSAGMALHGDINDANAVIQFFQNVRLLTDLDVTVLILTHVSKAHKERDEAAPIGSVFFENLARTTWEMKCSKVPGTNATFLYSLHCRKTNFSRVEPIAIRVTWADGLAFIEPANSQKEGITTGDTQKDVALQLLYEHEELSVEELAEMLGTTKQVVWNILSDLKREGLVMPSSRGHWRIAK